MGLGSAEFKDQPSANQNYGIKIKPKLINKTSENVMKMNLQPKIKETLIRHTNQAFVQIN